MGNPGQSFAEGKRSQGSVPPADTRGHRPGLAAIVVASTFLAYAATLRFGYIYDDYYLILYNNSLRSWRFLPVYFTGHLWSYIFPTGKSNAYRPLLLVWLRSNFQLFGFHAWGWHLTIVAAHVAVAWLVYRLAFVLLRDHWAAAAGALLFGLHPIHVETIAEAGWADQPLSTLFMLAAVLAWWRSRARSGSLAWLAGSWAFAAAALLSKESGMVLPLLISALAWIYPPKVVNSLASSFSTRAKQALAAGAPYWILLLAYAALRLWAMKVFSYILYAIPWWKALLSVPAVLVLYLRLLIWPLGLSCYYDTSYVSSPGRHNFFWPLGLLAGIGVISVLWYLRSRRASPQQARAMAFASLWLALTMIPVMNLRYLPKDEIVHDRYLYLPSVGFCILAGIGLRQICEALPKAFRRPAYALPAALGFFGLLGFATIRQSNFWMDEMTLRTRAHQIAPHNVCATSGLGDILRIEGDYAAALQFYRQALTADPDHWPAVFGTGLIDYRQGNYQEAVRYLLHACSLMPTDSDALATLSLALLHTGRPAAAEDAARSALLVNPDGKNYHLALAMSLDAQGRREEAKREINAELASDPQNQQAQALMRAVEQEGNSPAPKSAPNQPLDAGRKSLK